MVPWSIPLCMSPLHRLWLDAGKWGEVFHYINQLQFSIEGLHWALFLSASWMLYGGMCYCYSTSPSPHHVRVVVFGEVWVPLNLAGCVEVVWTTPEVFLSVIVDGWVVFDVIPVPIVCSTGLLGLRGIGFGFGVEVLGVALGMGGWGCWCFEFSEESAVSQGDSTWSVNSDTVLVVGECFDNLTSCVPLTGCWSLYCHYLPLLKGT